MKKTSPDRRPLQKMFSEVPRHYDLMNRLLTWRFDEYWRRLAVIECIKDNPGKILDLCCGTADLAVKISKKCDRTVELTGLDFSAPMLEIARRKASGSGGININFISGDAAQLPFPDSYFDTIGIAFAFRNLTFHNPYTKKYLSEILRTLSEKGRFVIIESSQPRKKFIKNIFYFYLNTVVSGLGGLISGHKRAYHYLAYSAKNFYAPDDLSEFLYNAGFKYVEYRSLCAGVAALHIAYK